MRVTTALSQDVMTLGVGVLAETRQLSRESTTGGNLHEELSKNYTNTHLRINFSTCFIRKSSENGRTAEVRECRRIDWHAINVLGRVQGHFYIQTYAFSYE